MFKLLVFSVFYVMIQAKPSIEAQHYSNGLAYYQPVWPHISTVPSHISIATEGHHELAKVGDYIESVPTAISHQSSTVVHDRANVRRSIFTPIVRSQFYPHLGYPWTTYSGAPYVVHGYSNEQLYNDLNKINK